jgi:hypothetical protein
MQGLDTDANVLSPKVVEALLGTRFRGRQFGRGPLVRFDFPEAYLRSFLARLHLCQVCGASRLLEAD